ncbi:MAG: hypothetical protein WAN36_14315 [Calditrichia bacterium]
MKNLCLVTMLFLSILITSCAVQPQTDCIDWACYSKNLEFTLASANDGCRKSALQHICNYTKFLKNIDVLVQPLSSLAQTDPDEEIRSMAEYALYKISVLYGKEYVLARLEPEQMENPLILGLP